MKTNLIFCLLLSVIVFGCNSTKQEDERIIYSIFDIDKTKIVKCERRKRDGWKTPFVIYTKLKISYSDYLYHIDSLLPRRCLIGLAPAYNKLVSLKVDEEYVAYPPKWFKPNFEIDSNYNIFYDIETNKVDSCINKCHFVTQYYEDHCYLLMDCNG